MGSMVMFGIQQNSTVSVLRYLSPAWSNKFKKGKGIYKYMLSSVLSPQKGSGPLPHYDEPCLALEIYPRSNWNLLSVQDITQHVCSCSQNVCSLVNLYLGALFISRFPYYSYSQKVYFALEFGDFPRKHGCQILVGVRARAWSHTHIYALKFAC